MRTPLTLILLLISIRSVAQLVFNSNGATITEYKIGETLHSNQSNNNVPSMLVNHGNNTLSAAWTMLPNSATVSTIDRGTGYNFFNGLSWQTWPLSRLEYKRTGGSNIAAAGGYEYCLAFTGDSGLFVSKRLIGNGAWNYIHPVGTFNMYPYQSDVWARFAAGGANENTLHVIMNSQGTGTSPLLGQSGPMTYCRSTDGGLTWDMDHIQLPLSDSGNYPGVRAENYNIDCRGDVVAVVAGGLERDICLWKSLDNGGTWTRQTILAFPIPQYDYSSMISDFNSDGIVDTFLSGNLDVTVTLDNNGIAHVAFGAMKIFDNDTASYFTYLQLSDGLYYWNENMQAPQLVAFTEDINGNGKIDVPDVDFPYYPLGVHTGGMIIQPSIGVDDNNSIFLAYAAPDESADTSVYHCLHRHIYIKRSDDGGLSWSQAISVMPGVNQGGNAEFLEGAYPSIAQKVNSSGLTSCAYLLYQRDPAPFVYISFSGGWWNNQSSWNADSNYVPLSNDIIMSEVCIASQVVPSHEAIGMKIWPNPVKDQLYISIPESQEDAVVDIIDLTGRILKQEKFETFIETSDIKAGWYLLRLSTKGKQYVSGFVKVY